MFLRLASLFFSLILVAAADRIETFAGTGMKGFSGDGGPASAAQLNNPFGVTRGPDGALYICDTDNHRIRRVERNGMISTVAGNGTRGYSGDGGPALLAMMNEPYEVRFDRAGAMYVVERLNHLVRKVDLQTGRISTVAGTGSAGREKKGGQPQFHEPHSIAFDPAGNLYVCDIRNHRVQKVDIKTGVVADFAGTGEAKMPEDGVRFEQAPLKGPRALDFDRAGNLWLALREGNAIYRFDLARQTLHHIAGVGGKPGFAGNGGPAKAAVLGGPKGISMGPDGHVYFADTETHSVRRIDLKRDVVELVAGTGMKGDGALSDAENGAGDPLQCRLARPHGIFVDADGSIFIGDSDAHRVRVIRPSR